MDQLNWLCVIIMEGLPHHRTLHASSTWPFPAAPSFVLLHSLTRQAPMSRLILAHTAHTAHTAHALLQTVHVCTGQPLAIMQASFLGSMWYGHTEIWTLVPCYWPHAIGWDNVSAPHTHIIRWYSETCLRRSLC